MTCSLQESTLLDGAGARPGYSLRTLCRALEYAATATPMYGLHRALYDGFAMAFLTQLNDECAPRVEGLLQRAFNPQNSKVISKAATCVGMHLSWQGTLRIPTTFAGTQIAALSSTLQTASCVTCVICSSCAQGFLRAPPRPTVGGPFVLFDHFWVATGDQPLPEDGADSDGGCTFSCLQAA